MFKRNKLSLAIGIAVSAISQTSMACEAPSITKFTVSDGLVYGVAVGTLEGFVPACHLGDFVPQVTKTSDGSTVGLTQTSPVSPGQSFSRTFYIDGVNTASTVGIVARVAQANWQSGDPVALSSEINSSFVEAQLPTTTKAASISENGGILATLNDQASNCTLVSSANAGQAYSRTENFCLVQVSSPDNNVVFNQDKQIVAGASTPGVARTASWQIVKFDSAGQPQVVAQDSISAQVEVVPLSFVAPFPATVQATQPFSVRLSEPGAMLALTKAQAQAYSQAGSRGYEISLPQLPPGLKIAESNGEIEISGRILAVGQVPISITPTRVLADGTEILHPTNAFAIASTLPAVGVTVPQSKTVERFGSLNFSASVSGGICDNGSLNAPVDPAAGGCYFRWTPPEGLVANGPYLSGTPKTVGTQAVPWKLTYEVAGEAQVLELASGSMDLITTEAKGGLLSVSASPTGIALEQVQFDATVAGCSLKSNLDEALMALNPAGGNPTCIVNAQFPPDFVAAPSQAPGQYSGTFKTPGKKVVIFSAKTIYPDSSSMDSAPVEKAITIADHAMKFSMTAPDKMRLGKTATAQIVAKSQDCALTLDANAFNESSAAPGSRSCLVSLQGVPQGWTAGPDSITGTMDAQDALINWSVSYPLKVGDSIQSIELAKGTQKIASYVPVAPEFHFGGRLLGENILGVTSKGDLGILNIDKATPDLFLSARFNDASGATLLDVPRLGDKSLKTVRIPELGAVPLMQQKPMSIKIAYADGDSDVFTERNFSVIRVPDAVPSIQVDPPARVKVGNPSLFNIKLGEARQTGFVNDPNRIGNWKIHLAKVNKDGSTADLTAPQQVTSSTGDAQISLPAAADWLGTNVAVVASLDTDIEALKKVVKTRPFVVQEYLWPTFDIDVRQPVAFAPSAVRFTINPSDRRFLGQATERDSKVTYTWRFPEAATSTKATGSIAFATFEQAGDYEISVDIEDVNGNKSTVTKTVSVASPKAYNVDLKMNSANKWPERAPASFSLRPQITGGHPSDRITSYAMKVNGTEVHNATTPPRAIDFPNAGEQTIELTVGSKMGAAGTVTKTITLAPNKAPVCELTQKVFRATGTVAMKCTDSDGRIAGYTWTVGGVTKQLARNTYSFAIAEGGTPVEVTATDDVGATTTLTTTVSK